MNNTATAMGPGTPLQMLEDHNQQDQDGENLYGPE
jgi:hypothetical protein